ncbi:pyocin knob domain-containing protein [Ruegeria sp. 2012CJ41-6]|uniref:Pyocin knob domain-containing protein n=1 Tax=Ruegeria spongiae TaxID=2942209 RepID=A0ABT0Q5V2_9RHOB|nr:pyocin knob domain-containing protein [Ruegeria spongiae]MCL6285251.1 pyocin knob domain-containing protein [Ruegeria spongiae]
MRIWNGSGWIEPPAGTQNLDGVGIGAVSDSTNRLSLRSPASLFSHDGAGHQLKVNKAGMSETASVLFQSDWTGHAEMGLAGDSAFSIKVSDDGATWRTALRFDPATGLPQGTAVQSGATDGTGGRLMTTGAFGLGGTAIPLTAADDLNALEATGFYYNPASGNVTGNNYPITSAGALLNLRRSATNRVQMFTSHAGTSGAEGLRSFTRSFGTNGWSPWVETFHQGTLLGPVSQSGGLPTGRVIERGGNANGDYVRFADGTQICTNTITVGSIIANGAGTHTAPYFSDLKNWIYPASFAAAPAYSVAPFISGTLLTDRILIATAGNNTTTRLHGIRCIRVGGSANDISPNVVMTAIGRWF